MAMQVSLVVKADLQSDVKSLSLLANAAGFALKRGGYQPGMALDGVVSDVLTVDVIGSSHDDLAVKLQALEEYFQRARWANESPERYEVWLRVQLTNETNARKMLVVGGSHGDKAGFYSPPASPGNRLVDYPIVIDRLPICESNLAYNLDYPNLSSVGGKGGLTIISGDVPARIAQTILYGVSGAALVEYWWGFRSARFGTVANFVSPWECELGTVGTDTSATTDATASPGGGGNTKLLCTFATNSAMASRFTLTPYQISSTNFEQQRGTFNLIARLKVNTGFSTRVRIASGLGSTLAYCDDVAVTSTAWKFYDLGRITLPAGGKTAISAMQNSIIRFEAQRIAGTLAGGTGLHMDCLVPIPANEGYAHISGGTGVLNTLWVDALGRIGCFDYTGGNITGLAGTEGTNAQDYTLPIGSGGIVVVAAQQAAGSTLTDLLDFEIDYFHRYRTLRTYDLIG